MENKIYKLAVIGCGSRARGVISHLIDDDPNRKIEVVSIYDPDPAVMKNAADKWNCTTAKHCSSYQEAIDFPGVDWVMVFSPNAFHKEHVVAAFKAGKHVFSEKPLATQIDDCVAINDAHQASGKHFATGFVLRYSRLYRKVKEILDSGILGKIMVIEGNENIPPEHGGYIMCNWRRHTDVSGPHILEKCCHDLDLIEWFAGDVPLKVSAMGGKNFFIPENNHLLEKYGKDTFMSWPDPHRIDTPFSDDNDLMDNLVSIAEFRNSIRVSFACSMSNAIPERRLSFCCSEGSLKLDLYQRKITYRVVGDPIIHTLDFSNCDNHGGGDKFIMEELYDTISKDVPPKCAGREGLLSAVYAIAINEAAVSGKIVDLTSIWQKLNV